MNCRIYLVRHGVTDWNRDMRYQGQTNVPLSGPGREQAKRLSLRLAPLSIDAFYASDLDRAGETARILAEPHALPVNVSGDLREINFGLWEGLTAAEVGKRYPGTYKEWVDNPLGIRPPEGETYAEVAARTVSAILSLAEKHRGGNIAVVTHGGVIRCIIGSSLGMDLNQYWRLRLDNASLSIIEYPEKEKGILLLFNDVSHLEQNVPPL